MICDGCIHFYPFRRNKCSMIPRTVPGEVTECSCRTPADENVLKLRVVTQDEWDRMVESLMIANTDETESSEADAEERTGWTDSGREPDEADGCDLHDDSDAGK